MLLCLYRKGDIEALEKVQKRVAWNPPFYFAYSSYKGISG